MNWRIRSANLVSLFVQCEVPSVEQVDFRIRKIVLKGFRTRRDEGRVVLAPDHEGRRLVFAEPGLPFRVGRDVGPIVVEQVPLESRADRVATDRHTR